MTSPKMFWSRLMQDKAWTEDGKIKKLEDLDPHHRANLIPFFRRNAVPACFAVTGHELTPSEAEEWLEQMPLMRRLTDMEKGRTIDDRRATHLRNEFYEYETGYEKIQVKLK